MARKNKSDKQALTDMQKAVVDMAAWNGFKIDFSQIDPRQFRKGKPLTFKQVRDMKEGLVYGVMTEYDQGGQVNRGIWQVEWLLDGNTLMLSQGSFGLDIEAAEFGPDDEPFVFDNEYYCMELHKAIPRRGK